MPVDARRRPHSPSPHNIAKQYLAVPVSSAGVKRVFSAAGKMHSDLRKSMSDVSLKHSLFAAYNTKRYPER